MRSLGQFARGEELREMLLEIDVDGELRGLPSLKFMKRWVDYFFFHRRWECQF